MPFHAVIYDEEYACWRIILGGSLKIDHYDTSKEALEALVKFCQ